MSVSASSLLLISKFHCRWDSSHNTRTHSLKLLSRFTILPPCWAIDVTWTFLNQPLISVVLFPVVFSKKACVLNISHSQSLQNDSRTSNDRCDTLALASCMTIHYALFSEMSIGSTLSYCVLRLMKDLPMPTSLLLYPALELHDGYCVALGCFEDHSATSKVHLCLWPRWMLVAL